MVDVSGARLGTGLAPGLHSGVGNALFAQTLGEERIDSGGAALCGLGVFVALCEATCDKLMCNG